MSSNRTTAAQRQAATLIERFGLGGLTEIDEVARILENLGPGDLVDEPETSIALGPAIRTLRNWRAADKGGPPYIKIGDRMVRYVRPLFPVWIASVNKRTVAA